MRTLKIRVDGADQRHVKITLFMGHQGRTLANVGSLTMTVGEYQIFGACMSIGAGQSAGQLVVSFDDEKFLRSI